MYLLRSQDPTELAYLQQLAPIQQLLTKHAWLIVSDVARLHEATFVTECRAFCMGRRLRLPTGVCYLYEYQTGCEYGRLEPVRRQHLQALPKLLNVYTTTQIRRLLTDSGVNIDDFNLSVAHYMSQLKR